MRRLFMKKSKEIIGLPVMSIEDGIQIGSVQDLVINPKQKNVEILLLDEKNTEAEMLKGCPYLSIEAVGDYAVTVKSLDRIIDVLNVNSLKELTSNEIYIYECKVITNKGEFLGNATEFSINLENGQIEKIHYQIDGGDENSVDINDVITIGTELIVIEQSAEKPSEKTESKPSESTQPASEQTETAPQEKAENTGIKTPATEPQKADLKDESADISKGTQNLSSGTGSEAVKEYEKMEEMIQKESETTQPKSSTPPSKESAKPDAEAGKTLDNKEEAKTTEKSPEKTEKKQGKEPEDKLMQQQKQYVLGKTLIRDIKSDDGEVLAHENEVITEEIFQKLYEAGSQKIVEAMTYVKD